MVRCTDVYVRWLNECVFVVEIQLIHILSEIWLNKIKIQNLKISNWQQHSQASQIQIPSGYFAWKMYLFIACIYFHLKYVFIIMKQYIITHL